MLIVNGRWRARSSVNASFGVLVPAGRPTPRSGARLALVIHNIGRGWPGAVAFAGLGQPGRYTLLPRENGQHSPWARCSRRVP